MQYATRHPVYDFVMFYAASNVCTLFSLSLIFFYLYVFSFLLFHIINYKFMLNVKRSVKSFAQFQIYTKANKLFDLFGLP